MAARDDSVNMEEKQRLEAIGRQLRERRQELRWTLRELARRAQVSASFLSYLEKGARRPSYEILDRLMRQLQMGEKQRANLVELAEYEHREAVAKNPSLHFVLGLLENASVPSSRKAALVDEICRVARAWKDPEGAKLIRTAVIPAAGWQARLLSAAKAEEMLGPAVDEAIQAGLTEIVLILAPRKPHPEFKRLPKVTKLIEKNRVTIRIVEQPQQLGLGDAVLRAQGMVGGSPFIVILPDDIVLAEPDGGEGRKSRPSHYCLSQMIEAYTSCRTNLVAVTETTEPAEIKHYGSAELGGSVQLDEQYGQLEGRIYRINWLAEKSERTKAKYSIVGRYVLTPDVFDALEVTSADRSGEIQLTDALLQMNNQNRLLAYLFEGRLIRVALTKMLIESLVDGITHKRYEALESLQMHVKQELDRISKLK